jgi:hypothetical protein
MRNRDNVNGVALGGVEDAVRKSLRKTSTHVLFNKPPTIGHLEYSLDDRLNFWLFAVFSG